MSREGWTGFKSAAQRRRDAEHQKAHRTSDGVKPGGGHRKLTDEQLAEARKMLGPGFKTKTEVARHFGVSITGLTDALKREAES